MKITHEDQRVETWDYCGGMVYKENKKLYQGKELEDKEKLHWYDFHARRFDSQIGRWHAVDPLMIHASPYIGMANNPVFVTDFTGMAPDDWWQWIRRLFGCGGGCGERQGRAPDQGLMPSQNEYRGNGSWGNNAAAFNPPWNGRNVSTGYNGYDQSRSSGSGGGGYEYGIVHSTIDNYSFDDSGAKGSLPPAAGISAEVLIHDHNNFIQQASSGGGWEPYAGTAGAVASEMYYSEKYGTWMGKNFKMYKQQWGGNGYTGGKLKFGKKVSTGFKIGGYGLGIWNAYNINSQHSSGQISDGQMYMEQGSNVITTVGGLYGAAWGVGWELGRAVTNTGWYQEAKFNFWYNRWESQVGPPSQSNEVMWNYFFQNYKP